MTELPLVLAGPQLRRLEARRLVMWLASSCEIRLRIRLGDAGRTLLAHDAATAGGALRHLSAGSNLHYYLLDLALDQDLPEGRWIDYELELAPLAEAPPRWQGWRDWAPDLCYPGKDGPGFVRQARIDALLHGSCRKPHHAGGDGLAEADRLLERCLAPTATEGDADAEAAPRWPALLLLTGDQVYVDDVAGPMLGAIHDLLGRLQLPNEALAGSRTAEVEDARSLYAHPCCYYHRERLLPRRRRNLAVLEILFGGVEKPVFTSDNAHNHLITLAEMLAMYLLVWSPAAWPVSTPEPPRTLAPEDRERYLGEASTLDDFVADLGRVRRLMAHLPVAMIFDDHDVTDDWNLSREWEEVAYGHPFSRRVVGNAIVAYLVNQAWGNRPEAFDEELLARAGTCLSSPGGPRHDEFIDELLRFGEWHFSWPTTPTHRWRSELSARRPSGLMDWESLTDLQQTLKDHHAVLMVSAAPIFGVKLIEVIQRVFTWLGRPLLVDAENWMAHAGGARTMLNIFRHPRTPQVFVVLSGDVHYSFVYDVELRGRALGPDIWQICSSGVRNEFPPKLLDVLDRANRWLFSPRSPFNLLTRRRRTRVIPRKPEGTPHGRRLLNGSGIGLVELDAEGRPWRIRELLADGRQCEFTRREDESRWD